jgi:tetratricopeptide (TPR) repeat protein
MITRFLNSDRHSYPLPIVLILFLLIPAICRSQNLYDLDHSRRYAEFLLSSKQHTLASEEYERLVFMDESNEGFKYNLIKSYRLLGDYTKGIDRIYSFYTGSVITIPQNIATEFIKLELLTDSLSVVNKFLSQYPSLTTDTKVIFISYTHLLNGDYREADLLLQNAIQNNQSIPTSLKTLSEQAINTKFKSPFVAAGFSAIIPGSGKFYTKNWSDGVMSLLFVAGNAWQAHRGFKEDGVKSVYGWVFASVSTSFYIGNIFGSAKSAKLYNSNKRNEIRNQIYEVLRSDNF